MCTSSNARAAFEWAFRRAGKVLFLPDQNLGRNTAFAMGIALNEMVVWDPYQINGGVTPERLRAAKVILWKGHCSVHQRFLPEHVDRVRREEPGMQVVVHPECRWEVCQKADALGSTERIIELIEQAPVGSSFAVGTEVHLVNRLAERFRVAGQARDYAGRVGLPVHHDVSHLSPASCVGAGESNRRARGEPHPSRRQSEALGARCTGSDVGDQTLSRTFTLNEAQTLLPVLEALLRRAQAAGVRTGELEMEMQELNQRIFLAGGMRVDVAQAARRRAEREKALQEARDTLAEMDEIGVQVKDLEKGLLDFPSVMDGHDVLLCWKLGEKEIGYWHTPEDGFAGRKPLDVRSDKTHKERLN